MKLPLKDDPVRTPLLITCGLILLLTIVVVSCGFVALGIWWLQTYQVQSSAPSPTSQVWNLPSPSLPPSPTSSETATPSAVPSPILPAAPSDPALETLNTLLNALVPINDPLDLAQRLEGKTNLPRALTAPVENFVVGSRKSFYVTNSDTNQYKLVPATLRYITDHVYFWVADDVSYKQSELEKLANTFEQKIYPTNRQFFGSEWTPGVDADPHLFILYTRGLGSSVAGYFSTADEYLPLVRPDSNGHEMFIISADHLKLGEPYTYGVLAHEFQHMIHWYTDRNEESWVNEGFSELAMFLNGYETGRAEYAFIADPDIQLTDWPDIPGERSAHYGASFLFMTYFLDRFGNAATQSLVAEPENGMVGIDIVLQGLAAFDPLRQRAITADDIFTDWTLANFLHDENLADGRFAYHNYPKAPQAQVTEAIENCSQTANGSPSIATRQVRQYGADYLLIRCAQPALLRFTGASVTNLLPADPYSGQYMFYSNRGDESDMTLTRLFDFRAYTGPLTLSYYTWYDLEKDYDYVYLVASEDGETWQILTTPSGTAEDPSGNSFGWGYNGASGGWIQETVDISAFAGKQVYLRFEYVTDAAVNGEGLLLDDIAIPEVGYFTDFEGGADDWEAAGFVRVQNALPQTFRLTLILRGRQTTVQYLELSAANTVEVPLPFGPEVREAILVISGTTRFTRQPALYQFSIVPR